MIVDRDGPARRGDAASGRASRGSPGRPGGREVCSRPARSAPTTRCGASRSTAACAPVLSSTGRLVLHDVAPDGRVLLERATVRSEIVFRRAAEAEDRDLSWLDYSAVAGISPERRHGAVLRERRGRRARVHHLPAPHRRLAARARRARARARSLARRRAGAVGRHPQPHGARPDSHGPRRDAEDPDPGARRARRRRLPRRTAGRIFVTGRDASGQRATWLTDVDGQGPAQAAAARGPLPQAEHLLERRLALRRLVPRGRRLLPLRHRARANPTPMRGAREGLGRASASDSRGRLFYRERSRASCRIACCGSTRPRVARRRSRSSSRATAPAHSACWT